jgi:8-oxo-dGTP pyrophosphatase MutT (NUDIX family)
MNFPSRELHDIIQKYGNPISLVRTIELDAGLYNKWEKRFHSGKRISEVVFSIRDKDSRFLLISKSPYPSLPDGRKILRLPSGSIERGEKILAALEREIKEETSFDCDINNFTGNARITFISEKRISRKFSINSYVFIVEHKGGIPHADDRLEKISLFKWVEPEELKKVAEDLKSLPEPLKGWGEFRSIAFEILLKKI